MTDLIVFIRDNIDDDPNLLSTITNNTDKPEHEKLLKAYSEYMRKYGRDYEKNNVRTDVEDFRKIADAVQAFKLLMDDDDDVDLFDLNDNDNVNDDNLDSLLLNNEEDLNEMPKTHHNILTTNKGMAESKYNFSRGFNTPSKKKLSSLFDDTDDENANNDEDTNNENANNNTKSRKKIIGQEYLIGLNKNDYESRENSDDDDPASYKPISHKSSKRANKTMETVKSHLKDDYIYDNRTINTSEFRDSLWNILINGNYRVKFSPKCSTRIGAQEYCLKKFDEKGYPLYRLIPTNTKDDFGKEICDLNGDKVDDIVIVDKSGRPVIINGYKLVKASPYKKIWQEERAENHGNIEPFNIWLQKKFELAHTWDYSKEDWETGQRKWDIGMVQNEKTRNAYQNYIDAGVGKPKLNKRITARGLWSSIFSRIWTIALTVINEEHKEFMSLKPIFNYMKVSNAMFIKFYELPAMEANNCQGKWMKWVSYKNLHSKEVNAEIGMKLQQDYNKEIKAILPLDGSIVSQEIEQDSMLGQFVSTTITTIIAEGMNSSENTSNLVRFGEAIANGNVSKDVINQAKETFKVNIDKYVDNLVGGNYIKYKKIRQADKNKNIEKADTYIKFNSYV
mgnify:CR=1 FL=1